MGIDRPIDITTDQRKTILSFLERHLPNTTAWVYGSRAQWTSRPQSDLDLVVFATPEQNGQVSGLREAFEESNLPFRVDLFVWDSVPEAFRKHIKRDHVELVKEANRCSSGEWRQTVYGRFSADLIEDCLANLCDPINGVQTGPFGSQLHKKDYVPAGTPIITVEHLGDNRILHQDMPHVSDHDRKRLSKYILHNGDIVFSRVGSVDRRALVRETESGWLFSGRCLRVRPDPQKIDSAYLSYFFGLPSFKEHIRAIAVGATMPSLNTKILSDIAIPHPCDLAEQRAIAHILGTLDDKIELNRRMNETLEAMARALFKSWFVDFDPVRAKVEGRDHGLPKHIADLFPDRFVNSELGEIPEGWRVGALGDVLRQRVERCRVSEETASRPYVPIDCISPKSLFLIESKLGKEAKSSLTKFYTGDLIFGAMRPYYHKVCIAPFDGTTRTTAFVLYPKRKRDFAFATLLLHDPDTIDFATRNSTGSTIPYAVWTDSLEAMTTIIPTSGVLKAFNDTVRPLLMRIPKPYFESRTLAALRDALLPKLITGELRVKDAGMFFSGAS